MKRVLVTVDMLVNEDESLDSVTREVRKALYGDFLLIKITAGETVHLWESATPPWEEKE